MEFSYDPAFVASEEGRPLSLSLPINLDGHPVTGEKVGSYFDNLLPDSDAIRRRIQSRYGLRTPEAFDLLAAIGRDCVGAVQLLPEGERPEDVFSIQATALRETEVEHLLNAVTRPGKAFGVDEDDAFRISLAGAQEKTALVRHRGRFCIPRGSTPTTHIFKLPLGLVGNRDVDMTNSLENEWLCARILAAYGLPVAECELSQFGAKKTLIVTRFDRALHRSGRYWLRLLQEDLCQATGRPSGLKHESDGGPGLIDIARVLQASEARDDDLATLMRSQLLFWMLAATDGHAKNLSIRLLAQGRFHLTPLYDVLSAWPVTGTRSNQLHRTKVKLAMALSGKRKHYRIAEIRRRHFNATAHACGLGANMERIISDVIEKTPSVIERVGGELPRRFPEHLFESITSGLARAARELRAQA
jgi:serine/threonine-protein kinase HipA